MRSHPFIALRRVGIAALIAAGALVMGVASAATAVAQSPAASSDPVRAGINWQDCGNPCFNA